MKAYAAAIDQELSTDMTNSETSTDVISNEAMTPSKKSRSVQLYFVLIMLCIGRALVSWYCERKSHRASEVRKKQGPRLGTVEGFEERRKATRKISKAIATSMARQVTCRRIADPRKRVHSKLARTAWQRPDASTWQASIFFVRKSAVVRERSQTELVFGIDSCVAVIVFPRMVADDYPMLQTPIKAKSYGQASGNRLL